MKTNILVYIYTTTFCVTDQFHVKQYFFIYFLLDFQSVVNDFE